MPESFQKFLKIAVNFSKNSVSIFSNIVQENRTLKNWNWKNNDIHANKSISNNSSTVRHGGPAICVIHGKCHTDSKYGFHVEPVWESLSL